MSDDKDKKEYPRPSLTADVVVAALEAPEGQAPWLKVLFVERARDPYAGKWALPGGFVEPTETVGEAALRELREETSLEHVRVDEVGCFSKPGRDPRGWVVSVAHVALVPADRLGDARAGDDAAATAWLDLRVTSAGRRGVAFTLSHQGREVTDLAFDHRDILTAALRLLVERVHTVFFGLLPETFTLAQVHQAYRAILGPTMGYLLPMDDLREVEPGSGRYARDC